MNTIFESVHSSKPVAQRIISTNELLMWLAQHPNSYAFLTHQLQTQFSSVTSREDELK